MTETKITTITPGDFPPLLQEINDPPAKLYVKGKLPDPEQYTYLTIVGSRRHSDYGAQVCRHLIAGLAGQPIAIVSGLAVGIDGIAHKSALEFDLKTVAIPGSGLDRSVLYPRSHLKLAGDILTQGGALISQWPAETQAAPWTFPCRNRLMAGLARATLVIEAGRRSGTLITARLATDYNRDVLAVPGSIFNQNAWGPLDLIKDGATPITDSVDIIEALDLPVAIEKSGQIDKFSEQAPHDLTPVEQAIYNLLTRGGLPKNDLFIHLEHPAPEINTALSMLELKGLITETDGLLRLQ